MDNLSEGEEFKIKSDEDYKSLREDVRSGVGPPSDSTGHVSDINIDTDSE